MFRKLFSTPKYKSPSGFFKMENDILVPIDKLQGNGSINDVVRSLGYPSNHVHTIFTLDSPIIESLIVKLFTRETLLVLVKEKGNELSKEDLDEALRKVDWNYEYASPNVEDMLESGIELENLTLDFLHSVLLLEKENENLYECRELGLYLQFEGGVLKHFTSASQESASTKWLRNLNPIMVQEMLREALIYQDNEFSAKQEVNKQTESLRCTPEAVNNPFLHLHRTYQNNISFFNILITHYEEPCTLEEFLFMNSGRYQYTGNNTYKVGKFIYAFNNEGKLESNILLQ